MLVERARTALFWVLGLWLLLSPGWVQLAHNRPGIVRPWQMYSGSGKGICDVQYFVRTDAGDEPLPRMATLRPGVPLYLIAAGERRVELSEIPRIGQQLCTKVAAEDVRAEARCAGSRGWHTEMRRDNNLCKPAPRAR